MPKTKQHPKYEKIDFAELAPTRKLVGFSRFSDEILSKILSDLNLSMSLKSIKSLQKYFYLGNPPSILSLKILDRYWSSGYGCLNREISQIELSTDNPHVYNALDLYNELREKYAITTPRTLQDILSISVKSVISDVNADVISDRGHASLECECYEKGHRTRYFTDIVSSWNDDENGALHRAIVESVINGGSPTAVIREELGGFTEERARIFAEYAENLDLSAFAAHGEYNYNTLRGPVNKASVMSFSDNFEVYSGEIVKGDKIFMVTFPNTDGEGLRALQSFLRDCNSEKAIVRAYSSDCGLLRGLLDEGKGFDIYLSDSINADLDTFLLSSVLNRIVLVVHKQNSIKVAAVAAKHGFPYSIIGKVTEKPYMRVLVAKFEISKLTFPLLKYRSHEFCVSRVEGGKVLAEASQSEGDNTELLKRNLSYAASEIEYSMNGVNSGKNVVPPFRGPNQATPAQIIAVTPHPERYEDVVSLMAVSNNYGNVSVFANTVNTILTAVMKLVISGVSIYDIAINTNFLFALSDDRKSMGMLLEMALASLYVENALSLANLTSSAEKVEITDGIPIFTATATGFTATSSLVSPEFKKGDRIFRLSIPKDEYGMPDIKYVLKLAAAININISTGNITAARLIEGSVIKGVLKGTAGSGLGFSVVALDALGLKMATGDLLLAITDIEEWAAFDCEYVGVVDDSGVLRNMDMSFERRDINGLATLFDLTAKPKDRVHIAPVTVRNAEPHRTPDKTQPVMTILHCDYAAETQIQSLAIANGFRVNSLFLGKSIDVGTELQRKVRELISVSDMLVLAGRSAYGRYSNHNFMYEVLHKPAVLDAVNKLMFVGDGLLLGTGEGARALVELGFLPHGTAEHTDEGDVKLTQNVGKSAASLLPRIRISNNFSPMLSEVDIGNKYFVAAAGRDMRFAADKNTITDLAFSGRIVGQFTDSNGFPTSAYPFNPTGSDMAIAAISSMSGKTLGFFCLPEKTAYLDSEPSLIKDIMKSSAKYFRGKESF